MSIPANLLTHFSDVFGLEGRMADNESVEDDLDGPGVNFNTVYLWRNIVGCAADGFLLGLSTSAT